MRPLSRAASGVTLERLLFDPWLTIQTKRDLRARETSGPVLAARIRPREKSGRKDFIDDVGPALAMVFPREVAMPVAPYGIEAGDIGAFGREAEIANRDKPRAGGRIVKFSLRKFAAEIAEGVQLFDIAGLEARLCANPVAQAEFEGAVSCRIEAAVGKAGGVVGMARGEGVGRIGVGSHDHGGQANGNRGRHASPP